MIVRCPDCSSRYRVREEKLPPGGGNIQCPNCGTVFPTVAGDALKSDARMPVDTGSPPAATSGALKTTKPSKKPLVSATHWKLRTPVGLVYDFPHIDALRSWLATRESFEGMVASMDGGTTWKPLSDYSDLADPLPKGGRAMTGPKPAIGRTLTGPRAAVKPPPPTKKGGGLGSIGLMSGPKPAPPIADRAPSGARQAVTGPTRAPSGPRPAARPPSRPYRATRTSSATDFDEPAEAGLGAKIAVSLIIVLIVAMAMQVSGALDIYGMLGFDSTPSADSAGNVMQPPPDPGRLNQPPPDPNARNRAPAADTGRQRAATPAAAGGERGPRESFNRYDPSAPDPGTATPTQGGFNPNANQNPFQNETPLQMVQRGGDPAQARLQAIVAQADEAARSGNVTEAIQLIGSASQMDRDNPELICRLADLHRRNGAHTEAEMLRGRCQELRRSGM